MRKYRRKPRKSTISKNIVPDSHIVRLRYVETFQLNPGAAGQASTHIFRANSIFDPNLTGVGHQPLGHDQWAVFYDHYNVIGSKITAKFISNGDDFSGPAHVGVLLKDDTTTIIDPVNIMEQSNSRYKVMTSANATQLATVQGFYSPKKFFAIKDISDNRSILGAAFGSNPVEDAYFHVYAGPLNSGIDTTAFNCIITIEYLCQFTERKALAQS